MRAKNVGKNDDFLCEKGRKNMRTKGRFLYEQKAKNVRKRGDFLYEKGVKFVRKRTQFVPFFVQNSRKLCVFFVSFSCQIRANFRVKFAQTLCLSQVFCIKFAQILHEKTCEKGAIFVRKGAKNVQTKGRFFVRIRAKNVRTKGRFFARKLAAKDTKKGDFFV